jgi:hypothetical protein
MLGKWGWKGGTEQRNQSPKRYTAAIFVVKNIPILQMSYFGQKHSSHGFVWIVGMPRTNIGIVMCAVNMGLAWKKNWVIENNWYSGDYYGETMKVAREVKITLVMTPDEALF